MQFETLMKKQREFLEMGETLEISFRIRALESLERMLHAYEDRIYAALREDLGKSREEAYMCELGLSLSELRYMKKHVRSFGRNRSVKTPFSQFHAKSFIIQEPYGVVLIMSPWNYPLLLTLEPLIGAIAAGNCCVVKPSAYAPATSRLLFQMLAETFEENYVAVVEGGREENTKLLEQPFDYIFFTGGVKTGKLVMEKASAHLTPVTLELGGKSPCIIDHTANIQLTARRLVFGKYLNCGQTCVAPDYVLAERSIKEELLDCIQKEIIKQYGEYPLRNPAYGKMVNQKHFQRVMGLIDRKKLVYGGEYDEGALQIAPTVLADVTEEDAVMQEEIFGPVLPILTVDSMNDAFAFIKSRPKPLALYLFTGSRKTEEQFLKKLSFGGGCVNDTVIHLATSKMGFGGVGESGMGSYHGRKSFETFSHEKSIVRKYGWLDLPMRYQPYSRIKHRLVKMFVK